MREIKYRQWDGAKFHYWGYFLEYDDDPSKTWVGPLIGTGIKPDASDQFTGLLDKNGREIYEGDVVHFSVRATINFPAVYNAWGTVAITPHGTAYGSWAANYCDGVIIIGNIHEHPELAGRG